MSKSRSSDGQGRLAQKSLQIMTSCRKESAHSSRKNGVVRRMFDSISDMQRAQKQTDHSVALLRRNQQILLERSDSLTLTCQRTSAIVDQLLAIFSLNPASVAEGEDALLAVPEMKFKSEDCSDGPRPAKIRRSSFSTDPPVGRELSLNEWSESVMVKAEPSENRRFPLPARDFSHGLAPSNGHDVEMRLCDESDIPDVFCRVKEETIEAFP